MALKEKTTIIDLKWTGTSETWDGTSALWTDETIRLVEYVAFGGSRGGVKKEWDSWNAWNKLDGRYRQKLVNVIVQLKHGISVNQQIDVNKYHVTVEDIELLREEYTKYKLSIKDVKVKVD